jgi:hypothetical protein
MATQIKKIQQPNTKMKSTGEISTYKRASEANYTIGISLVVRINRPEPLGHPVSSI